jgi:8-oxo-dGTP pyrophosphatase MutT (NUDIX family)
MSIPKSRLRVAAVVLRKEGREVLMVRQVWPNGTSYWQLPGGGVEVDESPEEAVLRELREETGLEGRLVRMLFDLPYELGISRTYRVDAGLDPQATLGFDPEEEDPRAPKLVELAWMEIGGLGGNEEIAAFLSVH